MSARVEQTLSHPVSAYPAELAAAVEEHWHDAECLDRLLPDRATLTVMLDTAYQASLLREEGDPVRCRMIFVSPQLIREKVGCGTSEIYMLRFAACCDFTPHEIRKLAAAANYYRALLAVDRNAEGNLTIWGMVVTGTQWVNRIEGGRHYGAPLPPSLVIQVFGPGHLIVASGYRRVLETTGGRLLTDGFDPFRSRWLPKRFRAVRSTLLGEMANHEVHDGSTQLCDSFVKDVAQSVSRRVVSLVRSRGHGGMLVWLAEGAETHPELDQWLRFRVKFEQDDSATHFHRLMRQLMRRVLQVGQARGLETVTWEHYQKMHDAEVSDLDEALVGFGHFLADLMSIDGCLVLDRSFRLIGFGAEILGQSHVVEINRALDLEGRDYVAEPADASGTRHRSAYRLVNGLRDAVAVVVSQDGAVRFVAYHKHRLNYWPYMP